MPFPIYRTYINHRRKEPDSFIAQQHTPHTPKERVSGFASQGSITVEATLALSLFFFAMITIMSLFEMIQIQTTVRNALCSVGKQMAAEACIQPIVFSSQMEQRMIETIGKDVMNRSMILGGVNGLDCSRSRSYLTTSIMELVVDYKLEIPILIFQLPILEKSESIRIKGWTGREGLGLGSGSSQVVYMTEYGMVYHTDMSCTYLELSIHPVLKEEADGYSACSYCGDQAEDQDMVFVTNYGDRYHSSLDCRGLKRKVYAVSSDEIYGIGACRKCTNL